MLRAIHLAVACVVVLVAVAGQVQAGVILSNTAGTSILGGAGYEGHSFTTAAGNSFDNLTWSWVSSNQSTLLAAGNLFLLTQEYLGSPDGLSAATPGFVAESTGIVSSAYTFAPSVTIGPSTQYFVYMGNDSSLAGGGFTLSDPFSGGQAYEQFSSSASNYFNNGTNLDFNFVLSGDVAGAGVVPEPTSLALLATGAFGFMGYGWRRKRKLAA